MKREQEYTPLFDRLAEFAAGRHVSFHVPGHKNGEVFPKKGHTYFKNILQVDMTELPGLDDLHAPTGVIADAEALAADYFKADDSFFLVGGSTAGNLAMILAACRPGEKIIVQRNSHKSIMNGLELAHARPVFIAPDYDTAVQRYTHPSSQTLEQALSENPDASAVVLTYPDYFGRAYDIEKMIQLAHTYEIPVLVDEAHGVHFSLGDPFPPPALKCGADIVVQSAHKMAPAMTMASFLHVKSSRIKEEQVAHFLQVIQSSSPSYPLLASLDIARSFLAGMKQDHLVEILQNVKQTREVFQGIASVDVLPVTPLDDPLKTTLHTKGGMPGTTLARLFEDEGIYPELATENQVLFIHGMSPFGKMKKMKKAVQKVREQLKISTNHATIDTVELFPDKVQALALSYDEMLRTDTETIPLKEAAGEVAAEPMVPYPPGIPLILKGERITETHTGLIEKLVKQGVVFQHRGRSHEIKVFKVMDRGEYVP